MVLGMRSPKDSLEGKRTKQWSYEVRNTNDTPYFKTVLAQLEQNAQQPINVTGNQAGMIEQVGKQNAYREFLQLLRKDLETAERMIAEDQIRQRRP
jgi:uncharacterized protein YgiM (DUF1202 family)